MIRPAPARVLLDLLHWTNRLGDRLAYAAILFGATLTVVLLLLVLVVIAKTPGMLQTFVPDFSAFWAAAALTLDGTPALAYDWEAHRDIQTAHLEAEYRNWMPWHYPPHFQLLVTPFGLLAPAPARAVWIFVTLAGFLMVVRRILPGRAPMLAVLLAGPTIVILVNGQTGFLTAALTGLALLWWHERPVAAGAALGLLAVKPQLALALPVAALAEGRWRLLAAATATALGLGALSVAALGAETWRAFFAAMGRTAEMFADGKVQWQLYGSVYGRLRLDGFDFATAMAVQGLVSAAVLWVMLRALRRPGLADDARAALIAYACMAISPRVLDYDMLTLFVGGLFQIRHARARGFFPGECLVLALALGGSMVDLVLLMHFASDINFVLAPFLLGALVLGERWREPQTARPPLAAPPNQPEDREPAMIMGAPSVD